jgi:hypothetical protein
MDMEKSTNVQPQSYTAIVMDVKRLAEALPPAITNREDGKLAKKFRVALIEALQALGDQTSIENRRVNSLPDQ